MSAVWAAEALNLGPTMGYAVYFDWSDPQLPSGLELRRSPFEDRPLLTVPR